MRAPIKGQHIENSETASKAGVRLADNISRLDSIFNEKSSDRMTLVVYDQGFFTPIHPCFALLWQMLYTEKLLPVLE